jgi:hypothetical protein
MGPWENKDHCPKCYNSGLPFETLEELPNYIILRKRYVLTWPKYGGEECPDKPSKIRQNYQSEDVKVVLIENYRKLSKITPEIIVIDKKNLLLKIIENY